MASTKESPRTTILKMPSFFSYVRSLSLNPCEFLFKCIGVGPTLFINSALGTPFHPRSLSGSVKPGGYVTVGRPNVLSPNSTAPSATANPDPIRISLMNHSIIAISSMADLHLVHQLQESRIPDFMSYWGAVYMRDCVRELGPPTPRGTSSRSCTSLSSINFL